MHVLILISIAKVPILEIAIETYLLLLVATTRFSARFIMIFGPNFSRWPETRMAPGHCRQESILHHGH